VRAVADNHVVHKVDADQLTTFREPSGKFDILGARLRIAARVADGRYSTELCAQTRLYSVLLCSTGARDSCCSRLSFLVFQMFLVFWEACWPINTWLLLRHIEKLLIGTNGSIASRIFPSYAWRNIRKARNIRMIFWTLPCRYSSTAFHMGQASMQKGHNPSRIPPPVH